MMDVGVPVIVSLIVAMIVAMIVGACAWSVSVVGVVVSGRGAHGSLAAHGLGACGPAARVFPGILLFLNIP